MVIFVEIRRNLHVPQMTTKRRKHEKRRLTFDIETWWDFWSYCLGSMLLLRFSPKEVYVEREAQYYSMYVSTSIHLPLSWQYLGFIIIQPVVVVFSGLRDIRERTYSLVTILGFFFFHSRSMHPSSRAHRAMYDRILQPSRR